MAIAIAVAIAAIVTSILAVGGPAQARRDKFDRFRAKDLRQIALVLRCAGADDPVETLPDALTPKDLGAYCRKAQIAESRLSDRETGQAYRYTRVSDTEFSVCAAFYDPGKARQIYFDLPVPGAEFDDETGCVIGQLR